MTENLFSSCLLCGRYDLTRTHRCHPQFEVSTEIEEGWTKRRGPDMQEVAEAYACQYFADTSGSSLSLDVWVREPDSKEATKFNVQVEMVPEATATEIETVSLPPDPDDESEPVNEVDEADL